MALELKDSLTASPSQVSRVTSANYKRPSLDMLQDTRESREQYLNLCVPLYKFALKGDWAAATRILDGNRNLLKAAIAKGWPTVLHVAAGANHAQFVEELIKLMDKEDLELQDSKNNTAFCFAAANGNIPLAVIMLRKNRNLVGIRGGDGMTPLHFAALQGRNEMAWELYPKTVQMFVDRDWEMLFFTCINTGIDDLALKMLEERPRLALARDENDETALHVLARNPLGFGREIAEHKNQHKNSGIIMLKQKGVVKIVDRLWESILKLEDSESAIKKTISTPSHILFDAAKVGNFGFLAKLMSSCPDLIWELDTRNRSIIHTAVLHRQFDIFNLIHEIGSNKDIIVTFVDPQDENNLLHLAAKLAPADQLELISGSAFQMRLELLWFEEVKKIMPPSYIRMKNSKGMTPQELFTKEHEELLEKAQTWMKDTAKSCMVVSTLITTGVFSAAFKLPGGTDKSGNPIYLGKTAFLIFGIADAIAMISSTTSILIFLSILISRYAQYDFYKSLPSKLICGMVALFISITTMMIEFSTAFFVSYYHGSKWVPSSISVIAALPTLVFVCLQYSLWSDIIYYLLDYFCSSLFLPSKHMLS